MADENGVVVLHTQLTPAALRGLAEKLRDLLEAGVNVAVIATGFWVAGHSPAQVWGRPAGLAVATDGSLLVSDDASGSVWRVSYKKP